MKNKIYHLMAIILLIHLSACNKYTDLVPKGAALIQTADDLERLANRQFMIQAGLRHPVLVNDMYPQSTDVPNVINGANKNWSYTLLTYDESVDRTILSPTDDNYSVPYSIININANTLINYADKVTGDAARLKRLKAEGYIMRAYMHLYLVGFYAKAYSPATAATDGGIPYVTEVDFEKINEKKTLKEVYDNILSDLEAGISSGALLDRPENNMRIGKAFAQGLKAMALLNMGNYAGAIQAADVALGFNSFIEDHRSLLPPPNGSNLPFLELRKNGLTAPDNIFYAYYARNWPFSLSPSLETWNQLFEPGSIIKNYQYNPTGNAGSNVPGVPSIILGYQSNNAGMTTTDLHLIKAECLIRTNKIAEGLAIVNQIRIRRVFPYIAATATDDVEAMKILQRTARIEHLYTEKNYFDLKRWNREGKYPVTISRTVAGKTYTLAPNSPLWVFPFPVNATEFNSTLTQNY